jgi:hypothetical protein
LIRIKGLALNIVMLFLLIPILWLTFFIKTHLMNEEIYWNDVVFIFNNEKKNYLHKYIDKLSRE